MVVLSLNFILGVIAGSPANTRGEDALPSEYQMKAAYLYNFAKFVEWPASVLPRGNSPLIIGVLGNDPFDGVLESTVRNKKIDNHPLVVRQIKLPGEGKTCHILFVSNSEKRHWQEISETLGLTSVLTVSENWDRFTQDGGMIYFFMDGRRVCFDINDEAARRAGLKVSSKLLLLRKKPAA